ncbi:MAG: OmpA family protein [Phocaeicola sp.]
MKQTKIMAAVLCASLALSSCGNMNNTTKGGLIGGGGGAALGALIGGIAGNGKGAAIGAAVGAAVGTGAGVLIGKKMDKAAKQAEQIEGAQVEQIVDNNNLQAVKVTFDSGILFGFNSSALGDQAKISLAKFSTILNQNPTMDIAIYGHTDKVGSFEANQKVSLARATAVESFLRSQKVQPAQFKAVEGLGYSEYNESLSAEANRRVEIYMYASEQMIQEAESGTLK